MTKEQKAVVVSLRAKGLGYGSIAKETGISANTIKSFCRRQPAAETDKNEHRCQCCGAPVVQTPGRKEKKFCSDKCRRKWWNAHPDQVDRRAMHDVTCAGCGKVFTVYGRTGRKYCCHACYIEDRFGGGGND